MKFLILVVLSMLTACSSFGYGDADIDTTRKAIVVANAEVRAANLLLQDLIERRVISASNAQTVLNNLRHAHDSLQTALDAVDANGDPVTASELLERANRALGVGLAILAPLTERGEL